MIPGSIVDTCAMAAACADALSLFWYSEQRGQPF